MNSNDQDLQTLFRASELALLSGPDRDAVRQSAQRLDAALKAIEAAISEKKEAV